MENRTETRETIPYLNTWTTSVQQRGHPPGKIKLQLSARLNQARPRDFSGGKAAGP
jgi:hypothetical protein